MTVQKIFVYEHLTGINHADLDGARELLPLGAAMRDAIADDLLALGRDDYAVTVATHDLAVPDGAHAVSARSGESAFDFVARQADAHALTWIVAPETDGVLAQLQRAVDPQRWIGCDANAIAIASSKRRTLLGLRTAGIATPLDFEHAPETTHWVVKPDDGAGAVATRRHTSEEAALADWSARSRDGHAAVVEPWIAGEALSVSLLCSERRTELLSVNRQRLAVDADGALSFGGVEVTVVPPASPRARRLQTWAERAVRAIAGLRGFVGIDLVWHPQRGPVLIEINPRVTCAYVGLSQALGRNLAADVIAAQRQRHG